MRDLSDLYYECHITVEPLFDKDLERFNEIVKLFGFRAAGLLMQKRKADAPERSKFDTFATARDKSYSKLLRSMVECIECLTIDDIKVWRYKIEDTIIDSKLDDKLELIPT